MLNNLLVIPFLFLSMIAETIAIAGEVDQLDTRFGRIEVVRHTEKVGADVVGLSPDTIKLNGHTVFRVPSLFIGLYESFNLGRTVAVLFGVNQGGSTTPNDSLHFLILKSGQKPKTLTKENFASSDGTIAPRVIGGDVVIVLGFEDKKNKIARLHGEQLTVEYSTPLPPSPMPDRTCEWLYEASASECIEDTRQFKFECGGIASGYSGRCGRVMTGITALTNHPGFISSALEHVCLQECKTGTEPALPDFKRDVCSIK